MDDRMMRRVREVEEHRTQTEDSCIYYPLKGRKGGWIEG